MNRTTHSIINNYRTAFYWLDPQDIEQEAALAMVLAARTWTPDGGANLDTYCNRAVAVALYGYCRRTASPVSCSVRYVRDLAGLSAIGLLPGHKVSSPSPERAIDYQRAAEAIGALLATTPRGHLAREVLIDEQKAAAVAERHGVPVRRVYQATNDAMVALRSSPQLRAFAEE